MIVNTHIENEDTFNVCLCDILFNAIKDNNIQTVKRLYTILNDNNIPVSKKILYKYLNGSVVPDFIKTKMIFECLGLKFSDSEIENILKESKIKAASLKNQERENSEINSQKRKINFILNVDTTDITELQIDDVIASRMIDIFGKEKQISEYLNYLIDKDIRENFEG